ncbi:MAG: D-lactate dehydrogenase, partial [Asticcacaulis sp.]
EPHSVIGSSCFGASVIGGISNNSGGALVRRGPAYTEMAVYAQVDEAGVLHLVNHMGFDLGPTPEIILDRLERGQFGPADSALRCVASDDRYADHVRDVEAATPARYNADPRLLHEASGCAGKLMVFAVRLDTFARETDTQTYYIGCNAASDLAQLRHILLTRSTT